MTSNCCDAPMTVEGEDGATRYFECQKCHEPCDQADDCLCGIYSKDNDKNITFDECPVHPPLKIADPKFREAVRIMREEPERVVTTHLTGIDKWLSEGFKNGYVHYLLEQSRLNVEELRKKLNH